MKKIIISLTLLFLSGCSVVQPIYDKFMIAPFDSNEYALVNHLRTVAIQTKPSCNTADDPWMHIYSYVEKLHETSLLLKNYSEYLPKNDQTIKPVNLVYQMTTDLKNRYEKETKVSKTYCELKIQSIIDASESIQKAIGKRPRP
jgi:hypothetical protein